MSEKPTTPVTKWTLCKGDWLAIAVAAVIALATAALWRYAGTFGVPPPPPSALRGGG